mgnify:FL=1
MNYTEVTIECKNTDEVCDKLTAMGIDGFVIETEDDFKAFLENNRQYWDYVDESLEESYRGVSRVKFYVEDNDEGAALLGRVGEQFRITTAPVCDADWENNWKQYYEPLEIGERLLVVPEWIDCSEEGRVPLRLDPGLLFGTGSHATTRMCLAALEKYAGAGVSALDLGCGSGILGIGALVLGSEHCTACDIDPKAPDTVMENAALNGIGGDKMQVYAGDIIGDAKLRKLLGSGYDVILANIVSDVIIPLAPFVRDFMAPGGVFITSGIIDGREDEVAAALRAAGLEIIAHHHEEEWHCFECR